MVERFGKALMDQEETHKKDLVDSEKKFASKLNKA
jgi:hypothetical protein